MPIAESSSATSLNNPVPSLEAIDGTRQNDVVKIAAPAVNDHQAAQALDIPPGATRTSSAVPVTESDGVAIFNEPIRGLEVTGDPVVKHQQAGRAFDMPHDAIMRNLASKRPYVNYIHGQGSGVDQLEDAHKVRLVGVLPRGVQDFQDKVDELAQANSFLEKKYESKLREVTMLLKQKEDLSKQVEAIKADMLDVNEEASVDLNLIRAQLNEMTSDNEAVQKRLVNQEELQLALNQQAKKTAELKSQKQDVTNQLLSAQDMLTLARMKLREEEGARQKAQNNYDALKREFDEQAKLSSQEQDTAGQLSAAQATLLQAHNELREEKDAHQKAQAHCDDLKRKFDDQARLLSRQQDVAGQLSAATDAFSLARTKLREEEGARQKAQNNYEVLKREFDEQAKLLSQEQDMAGQLSAAQATLLQVHNELREEKDARQKAQADCNNLKGEFDALKSQLNDQKEEGEGIRKKLNDDLIRTRKALDEEQLKLRGLRTSDDAKSLHLQTLLSEKDRAREDLKTEKQQNASLKCEKESLQDKLAEMREAQRLLEGKHEQERARVLEELTQAREETINKLDAQRHDADAKIASVRSEMAALRLAVNNKIAALEADKLALQKTVSAKEAALQAEKERYEVMQRDIQESNINLARKDEEAKRAAGRLEQVQSLLHRAEQRLTERENAQTRSEDALHALEQRALRDLSAVASGQMPTIQELDERDQSMDVDVGLSERARGKRPALPTPLHTPKALAKKSEARMNLYLGNTDSGSEGESDAESIPPPSRFKKRGGKFRSCSVKLVDRIRFSTPLPDTSARTANSFGTSSKASSSNHHRASTPAAAFREDSLQAHATNSVVNNIVRSPLLHAPGVLSDQQSSYTADPSGDTPMRPLAGARTTDSRELSPPVAGPGHFTTAGPSWTSGFSSIHPPAAGPSRIAESSDIQPPVTGQLHSAQSPSIQHPPAKLSPTRGSSTQPASSGLIIAPVEPSNELNDRLRLLEEKLDRLTSALEDNNAAQHSGRKRPPPVKPSRKRTVKMNNLQREVRKEQQRMFGIAYDTEILAAVQSGHVANPQDIKAFSLGRHEGPSLEFLKPDWDDYKSLWNRHLGNMFATHLCAGTPDYQGCEEQIAEHFINRLQTLQRILSERLPKAEDEEVDEVEANYQSGRALKLHNNRVRSRLVSLYQSRLEYTAILKNEGHKLGSSLYALVRSLGHEGQSDDESGDDDEYTPTEQYWRDPFIGKLLVFIDDSRRTARTTENGSRIPGAPPRIRTRSLHPMRSTRQPPRGLPINLYNAAWHTSLGEGSPAQLAINANPVILELPKDKNAKRSAR